MCGKNASFCFKSTNHHWFDDETSSQLWMKTTLFPLQLTLHQEDSLPTVYPLNLLLKMPISWFEGGWVAQFPACESPGELWEVQVGQLHLRHAQFEWTWSTSFYRRFFLMLKSDFDAISSVYTYICTCTWYLCIFISACIHTNLYADIPSVTHYYITLHSTTLH